MVKINTHRYWCYTHMMMRTSGYRLQVFRQVAQSHPPWSRDALDIAGETSETHLIVFPMWHDEKTMRDSSCISKIVQFLVFHMASATLQTDLVSADAVLADPFFRNRDWSTHHFAGQNIFTHSGKHKRLTQPTQLGVLMDSPIKSPLNPIIPPF